MAEPNWKNRTLWTGDNLHVMRGLNSESVDLIYLDPPFNSNQDYAAPIGSEAAGASFKDTWTLSDVDEAWHGEIAEQHPSLYAIIDAAGQAHGASMKSYLTMMAVRLLEMRRLLKPTGSLYLHCDPTASHYLKMLMDSVFGARNFRNEIAWKRTSSKNLSAGQYARNHDTILLFSLGERATWNPQYQAYGADYVERSFRRKDHYGRYDTENLTGGKQGGGTAYDPFHGVSPPPGRAWAPPPRHRFPTEAPIPDNYEQLDQLAKCEALDKAGMIYWSSKGKPRYKKYLSTMKGVLAGDIVLDIPPVHAHSKERTGYPTQKPLALLDRFIEASSNEGDIVLDPFCGCATALVSADSLNRQWVGIDLSPLAAELVKARLQREKGLFHEIHHRTDVPQRTDQGHLPHYRTHKHTLFGRQEGKCNGCGHPFPFANFEVDHVEPRAHGGTDHLENLQLLCNACNRRKGTNPQAQFLAEMKADYGALWEARR